MEATLAAARAGATTGEWAGALREVFGEFRAPDRRLRRRRRWPRPAHELWPRCASEVRPTGEELGGRLRLLVGKPGLDGHSNGAEQVAVRARDAGFEVVYQGIRLTPEEIVAAAVAEDVHCVGLSILSGSHMELVPGGPRRAARAGLDDVPVVVGGIIPTGGRATLLEELGVAAVFTPKDFGLTEIMAGIVPRSARRTAWTRHVRASGPAAGAPGRDGSVSGAARTGARQRRPRPHAGPRAARAAGREDLDETAVLLVSEMVTNALLHAGTDIDLAATVDATGVRVEVGDGSVHLPSRRATPPPPAPGAAC